mmetsp:Transcript_74333/g.187935  ORF Transcript_74333/g.187935 Transcript_74333/m.187935 type:complete len:373 (-) Transcript_74333:603-1721(-)
MEPMHASFTLGCWAAELESELACVELALQFLNRLRTDVLHPVFQALHQVRHIPVHGALILNGPRHALRHLHHGVAAKVAVVRALLHGVNGTHATVPLQPFAVFGVEVLSWRLLCACEEAPAHRCSRTQAERLDYVTRARDAPVGQDRDAISPGDLRHVVDRRGLSTAASAHLLSGANGADPHAHAQAINTALDEVFCLLSRDDVPSHHLQLWELRLHPPDDVVLEGAVALAAVHNDRIHAGSHQSAHTVAISGPGADGRRHHEAAVLVLGGEGEVRLFAQVSAGHQRHQPPSCRDDRQLAKFLLSEDLVGLGQLNTFIRYGQVCELLHYRADLRGSAVVEEVSVALGHKAHKLRSHPAIICHWETCEAVLAA